MADYDAIVVGAGHNGLTTAAYLARAGHQVLVLEQRSVVGGCAVTEVIDAELAPDCRVSSCAYIASMLRPEVIRDLELPSHGLNMVACDPLVQVALPGARVYAWWADQDRMYSELARCSRADADEFLRVESELKRLAAYLQPFFLEPPPDTRLAGLAGWLEALRVSKRFKGMNGRDLEGFVGFLTGSLGDFLERRFESDEVRRLMLANSLYGKHGGPFQAGTAVGLLFHLLSGGEGAEQGWSGHVIGGMGAVSDAIAAAAAAAGAEIRTGAAVQRIRSADHGPARVQLADGTEVSARIVVSNADPKRTFLDLIDPGELEDDFRRSIAAIRMDGPCAKVNFVLDREPQVAGMPDDRTKQQRSLITLVPTLEEAERSYGMSRAGRLPDDLWIDCVLASNVDPDLVTSGRHVMTCFVQFVPYRLQGAGWDEQREVFGDAVAARIERYMPGFRNSVVARRVLTPLDLEQDYGISEGNIFHGDPGLDQLFFMRPLPGWAQYRTPLPGIYLCGAGTHPGGGVTAAPGYNAAQCIIRDLA